MAVPKFYSFFYPVLETLKDGGVRDVAALRTSVAAMMKLSAEDRQESLPSGALTYVNRFNWALVYLKKAGLLLSPGRAAYQISPRGKESLAQAGQSIDLEYLNRFEEFRAFRARKPGKEKDTSERVVLEVEEDTPEDLMQKAFNSINRSLSEDILASIMERSPAFFERLVVKLLMKMGYGGALEDAGKVLGKSGDEGIDGIIREDKLGFSSIYIQAKCWAPERTISRQEIQAFVGALSGQGATKGLFITTARFTKGAELYARNPGLNVSLVLVDGDMLATLMIEHNLGVSPQSSYVIKKLDTDFFSEDVE